MKRYVVSSVEASQSKVEKLRSYMKAIRHDIGVLDALESIEDVDSADFHSLRFDRFIHSKMDKEDQSFEDVIESFIDYAMDMYADTKKELEYQLEYEENSKFVASTIDQYLKAHRYNFTRNGDVFYVDPADIEDAADFCDFVKDCIEGRYDGTGRGGSWTTWNLRSKDNVRVDVERPSSRNNNCYTIRVV